MEGNSGRCLYLQGPYASAIGCEIRGNNVDSASNSNPVNGLGIYAEEHSVIRDCIVSSNVVFLGSAGFSYPGIKTNNSSGAYLINTIVCGNYVIQSFANETNYQDYNQVFGPWFGSGNQVSSQCDFGDPPLGACCLETECVETDAYACSSAGGNYLGALTTCGQVDCSNEGNLGACCIGGSCAPTNEYACLSLNGEWSGAYTTCGDVSCTPPPAIAGCCLSDECLTTTQELCDTLGGTWQDEAVCVDTECAAWTGSCCIGTSCLEVTQAECFEAKGIFAGELTTCDTTDCPSVCAGDVNIDGTVDVNDILLLLGSYGPCP